MNCKKMCLVKNIFKKYKFAIAMTVIVICAIIVVIASPKTVASGNGYKHQIGNFGKCEFSFDGCTKEATHRLHHFFGNENYCDSHWDSYGEDMFLGLSRNDDFNLNYNENKCRHSGCEKIAKFSDWDRRYCAEHLQGDKYCRYPGCGEKIPINGLSDYCTKHKYN